MKNFELASAAVFTLALANATGRDVQTAPGADVAIWVTGDGVVPGLIENRAMATVTWMYARIGVRIAWLHGNPEPDRTPPATLVIHVRFTGETTGNHTLDALAYAAPFGEGAREISVMYNRVQQAAGSTNREDHLLTHVLAHEIGHVLAGTDLHAWTGVMKANWNGSDLNAMAAKPLEFTPAYILLIKQGLNGLRVRAALQFCRLGAYGPQASSGCAN